MPAWLALVLLGALTIGYCVAWVIVDRFILSYRPLGPDREWIKGHRVSHYLPIEHVVDPGEGTVAIVPQTKRHVLGFGPVLRKRSLAYVYVGENGRGGILNHGFARGATYARYDIDGADFLTWLGTRKAYYRRWDGALAADAGYSGPGTIASPLNPRTDRRRSAE